MSEHVLVADVTVDRAMAPGGIGEAVAAMLGRVRIRRVGRPSTSFPAAVGATDRELARLHQTDVPIEVLRQAHLTAASWAGHP